MTAGEWPEDPKDPRCPTCGEPVSATAIYCMHCEADLPTADASTAAASTGTAGTTATATDDAPMDEADPGMPTRDDDTGGTGARRGRDRAEEPDDAWIDPDSLLDDVSTVAVGLAGGLVDLVVLALLAFWALPEAVEGAALPIGVVGGIGLGLWIGYSPSVFDAARKAGYSLGGLLAVVPPTLALALDWQSGTGPIGGTIVFGIFVWPVALVVVGLGWLLGRGGVDDAA